ncbi:MAG: Rrf2 family transcriptional regulator [Candidatus Goldiibacteriota bacterium HGW-Goldbacteria-1]|jgi:Rrf2 family protein|nr:MAG: Rrf2 family transcriptional regulator [Candidatus Goldiibacteriota bacterium HGW-Goldbacteria-1]
MKIINKDTDYAVRALMTLAGNGDSYMSAKAISKVQNIPYPFLRRLLKPLIKNKVVESKEGAEGGVRLLIHPGKIKVIDLIKIYHKGFEMSECMFRGKPCCNRQTCVLRREVMKIEKLVTGRFEKMTIKSLLQNKN